MKIISIYVGSEESCACYTDTECRIGHSIPVCNLYITKDSMLIPTMLVQTKDGDCFIPSFACHVAKANKVWRNFIAPLDSLSPEYRTVFKTYLTELYRAIFSNPNNPINKHDDIQLYWSIDIYGWSDSQTTKLEEFLLTECAIPFAKLVSPGKSLLCNLKYGLLFGGISSVKNNRCVINYTDAILHFTYLCNNTILEKGYLLGANHIDKHLLDYLSSENPQNVKLLKKAYPNKNVDEIIQDYISRWKYDVDSCKKEDRLFSLEIHLRSLFLDKYFTGQYIGVSTLSSYDDYKQILSGYILKLYYAMKDFKDCCHDGLPSIIFVTGKASRFRFFHEVIETVFGMPNENTIFYDDCPETSVSTGTALYGCWSYLGKTEQEII